MLSYRRCNECASRVFEKLKVSREIMKCCMRNNADSDQRQFFFFFFSSIYPIHLSFSYVCFLHCRWTKSLAFFTFNPWKWERDEGWRKMRRIRGENDCVLAVVQVSRWALDKRSGGSFRCLALSPRDSILWERARTVVHARIGRAIRFIRLCAESIGKLWKPSSSCFAHRPSALPSSAR